MEGREKRIRDEDFEKVWREVNIQKGEKAREKNDKRC